MARLQTGIIPDAPDLIFFKKAKHQNAPSKGDDPLASID